MRAGFLMLTRVMLASPLLIAGYFEPAQAATLWQLLETAQKDCARVEQALKIAGMETTQEAGSDEDCSGAVTRLYLKSLRDDDRQQILQTAIKEQRAVLEVAQLIVEAGRGPNTDILVVEVDLKRLQLQEAGYVTARRHSRIVLETALAADPTEFTVPVIPAAAWPENKAAARSALASGGNDSQAMQQRLEHAWADYEGAKRQSDLLQPVAALTEDLAKTTKQWLELGQITVYQLSERFRDATEQKIALAEARSNLLAARLRVLKILGRTSAIK